MSLQVQRWSCWEEQSHICPALSLSPGPPPSPLSCCHETPASLKAPWKWQENHITVFILSFKLESHKVTVKSLKMSTSNCPCVCVSMWSVFNLIIILMTLHLSNWVPCIILVYHDYCLNWNGFRQLYENQSWLNLALIRRHLSPVIISSFHLDSTPGMLTTVCTTFMPFSQNSAPHFFDQLGAICATNGFCR